MVSLRHGIASLAVITSFALSGCMVPPDAYYYGQQPGYAAAPGARGAPATTYPAPPAASPRDPYASSPPNAAPVGARSGNGPYEPARGIDDGSRRDPDAQSSSGGEAVGLHVVYEEPKTKAYEGLSNYLQQTRAFDKIAHGLNLMFRFHQPVTVVWTECGQPNAYWDGKGHIVMCYDLPVYLASEFSKKVPDKTKARALALSMAGFAFNHELGHGLIAMFQLPAVGREEDAVDQLAALIMLKVGDDGVAVAIKAAQSFHLLSLSGQKTPFFDEHALDAQRFYNVVCLIYGSDPDRFQTLVGNDRLPESRARRCPAEYSKIAHAWTALLRDHIR